MFASVLEFDAQADEVGAHRLDDEQRVRVLPGHRWRAPIITARRDLRLRALAVPREPLVLRNGGRRSVCNAKAGA